MLYTFICAHRNNRVKIDDYLYIMYKNSLNFLLWRRMSLLAVFFMMKERTRMKLKE
ncbi:hypothetical protein HMPREF0083_02966 [Aneurinibacillus aneurinilyticus ATCC 12856]|uniref:Uncharacterized protein n=1 Tax=Aneurinibacillus aneurinilyticus ATCC 12856 TaxID=649747 RepID=U1X346_ANEAE|nr:hypothetical protein HMPREF0083_02966 [Aneurinibacillus aneurinilyticus ATCC 12856]